MSSSTFSSLMPRSSLMNCPPVSTAMSPRMALRRSPKAGAFTAQTCSTPRSLLTTSAASASPSTSSAMISRGLPAVATFSSSGHQVAEAGDLLLVDQDVGVLQHRLQRVGVGHEVGRDVALVELHALDDLQLVGQCPCLPRR